MLYLALSRNSRSQRKTCGEAFFSLETLCAEWVLDLASYDVFVAKHPMDHSEFQQAKEETRK